MEKKDISQEKLTIEEMKQEEKIIQGEKMLVELLTEEAKWKEEKILGE